MKHEEEGKKERKEITGKSIWRRGMKIWKRRWKNEGEQDGGQRVKMV